MSVDDLCIQLTCYKRLRSKLGLHAERYQSRWRARLVWYELNFATTQTPKSNCLAVSWGSCTVWHSWGKENTIVLWFIYHDLICKNLKKFTRFVNGAVDSAQKSTYALNLYQLARVIGLPARFIDIRHALSHEELPTLPVLRDACQHVIYHTCLSNVHDAQVSHVHA